MTEVMNFYWYRIANQIGRLRLSYFKRAGSGNLIGRKAMNRNPVSLDLPQQWEFGVLIRLDSCWWYIILLLFISDIQWSLIYPDPTYPHYELHRTSVWKHVTFLTIKWFTCLEIHLSRQSLWEQRCPDRWGSTVFQPRPQNLFFLNSPPW